MVDLKSKGTRKEKSVNFRGKLCVFCLSLLSKLSAWVSIQMLALKEGVRSEEEGTVEEQQWETPGL